MSVVTTTVADGTAPHPCSLCWNNEPITLPEKQISIPGFDFVDDCQALAGIAHVLFQQASDDCVALQSIGSLCGCSSMIPNEESACRLCSPSSSNDAPTVAAYKWRKLEFLAEGFGGFVPTCEMVEAGLYSSFNDTDPYCEGSMMLLSEYCGCGAEQGSEPVELDDSEKCHFCHLGESVPLPNKTIDIVGFPFQTCGELAKATEALFRNEYRTNEIESIVGNNCFLMRQFNFHCGCEPLHEFPCPICNIGNSFEVPLPDKHLDSSFTKSIMGDMEISCGVLANMSMMWDTTVYHHSSSCALLQGLGTECGCPVPEEPSCDICPNALPEKSSDLQIFNVEPFSGLTCGALLVTTLFVDDDVQFPTGKKAEWVSIECKLLKYGGFMCGCNNGIFEYWGADTVAKKKAALWTQRTSAMLSLFGSIAILVDTAMKIKTCRGQKLFYQIMMGLSCSDVLSSIAWGLGPLPVPTDIDATLDIGSMYGLNTSLVSSDADTTTRFFGSHGNYATCKVQGVLLHLGVTSILFNAALSCYFKLSVVNGWSESRFTTKYRVLLIGLPAIIGVAVALCTIPFITYSPIACTIGSYESVGGWPKLIGLFYLPYGPAFIYIPLNTFYIYWKVRLQSRKGNAWRMPAAVILPPLHLEGGESSGMNRLDRMVKRFSARLVSGTVATMESQVLWQSCSYVAAFFASYGILLVVFPFNGYSNDAYWLYILFSVLTPIQGFLNSFVYFRKRIVRVVQCKKKRQSGRARVTLFRSTTNMLIRSLIRFHRTILQRRSTGTCTSPDLPLNVVLGKSHYMHDISSGSLSRATYPADNLQSMNYAKNGDRTEEEKVEEPPFA